MTRKEALEQLIAKIEAGQWNAKRDEPHFETGLMGYWNYFDVIMSEGSLDAAKALHNALLPGHYAQIHAWPMPEMARVDIGGGHTGRDHGPARAWLLAILRALLSQVKE